MFFTVCLGLLGFTSCGVYSFTGASIAPDVKTVDVKFFSNVAPLSPPNLQQTITEALKDKLNSQTSLTLVRNGGDLHFEGQITNYVTAPIAIQGNETASQNRLTITISVKFTNNKDDRQDFEKSFTRFADYDSKTSLSSVESALIDEIKQQLIQDVFNASIANW
ncbi:MAG: hypothetical protein K1X82_02435 [Bacteroidia bacterium]|nr:hypothetical protein [Bacteroidia bacterium]